jgi:hypothetical protein
LKTRLDIKIKKIYFRQRIEGDGMETGWRVEQLAGRGSQEQLPRASTKER